MNNPRGTTAYPESHRSETAAIRQGAPARALFMLLSCLALSAPAPRASADDMPTRIPTVTRLVALFSMLENNLNTALAKHDNMAVQRLLTADFELRSGERPGQPIARADWLRQVQADSPSVSRIEQMAVHDHGEIAVVSFLWLIDAGKNSERAVSVVDVWQHANATWQLATRYVAPAGKASYAIPGARFEDSLIEKK